MVPYIVLGILLGLPLLLGLLLRVGAPHLFFALLVGEFLERYFGSDLAEFLRLTGVNKAIYIYASLAVLAIPVLLTALFLKGTLKKSKIIMNLIPFVATGFVFAAFAAQLLPKDLQSDLGATELGSWVLNSADIVVGGIVILQLVYLWVINHPSRQEKHHK